MRYWLFMLIAIVTEVIGTLSMKHTTSYAPLLGFGVMYLMLIISYYSLAIAVQKIPLAVAYGVWEGVGMLLITVFSALLFYEPLTVTKMVAIFLIICGMLLLDQGTLRRDVGRI